MATRTSKNRQPLLVPIRRNRKRHPLVLLPAAVLLSIIFAAILLQDGLGSAMVVRAEQAVVTTPLAAAAATADGNDDDIDDDDDDRFDEDLLARETIEAGRGERDAPGTRDQWTSDDHLKVAYDARRPVSRKVQRLLDAYGLDCEGCDHAEAVRKVNKRAREEKAERARGERRREVWTRRMYWTAVAILGSAGYYFRALIGENMGEATARLQGGGEEGGGGGDRRAEFLRRQREEAARAAIERSQNQSSSSRQQTNPTWLDNEKNEVWTQTQEEQFQKALRQYYGVPKKERYVLIADKVDGKSRIECLTHHKMQGLLEKREEEMRRQRKQQQQQLQQS